MGVRRQDTVMSYKLVKANDFIPDIDGAFDILFTEILKDCKQDIKLPIQVQNGYCNVFQSNIS